MTAEQNLAAHAEKLLLYATERGLDPDGVLKELAAAIERYRRDPNDGEARGELITRYAALAKHTYAASEVNGRTLADTEGHRKHIRLIYAIGAALLVFVSVNKILSLWALDYIPGGGWVSALLDINQYALSYVALFCWGGARLDRLHRQAAGR